MRRAVFRRTTTGMALFPFLAVLICTMGSLIVLLVLVLQQSRVQASVAAAEARDALPPNAATPPPDAADPRAQELAQAKEDLDWRREMLATQREEQLENLSRMRKELSHLEDHVRRLEDQWKKLAEQAKQLQKLTDDKSDQSQATQEELEKLTAELAAKKKEVEEKKKKISTGPKSYALVPYVGKNGTRRRPIYIECAEVGIILHPEGVVFLPSDFQGPLGPGNPLDAALRTVREHWARQPDAASQGEPYPLLIVRPNGAVAYSMARAAMKSWEEEFGYELVEDSLELEFPPGDPELESLLARSIKDARSRQQVLAASMPSRYKAENGGGANGFAATPYEEETSAAPAGNRGTGGGFGFGGNPAAGGVDSTAGAGGGARGMNLDAGGGSPGSGGFNGVGGSGSGSSGMARGSGSGNSGGGSQTAGDPAEFAAGGTGAGANAAGVAGRVATANGAPGAGGGGATGGSNGGTAGGVAGPGGIGGGSSSAGASNGATMASADGAANGAANGQSAGAAQAAASRSSRGGGGFNSSSSGSNGSDGTGQATASFTPPSVARRRGQDWALRDKQQKATAISRPIRIRCLADRLVIVPERGDDQRMQVIPVHGDVHGSLDPFVTAIWKQVDRWGLAVANGYWKPVLNVEVGPGAEQNFQQLLVLLQGSGLEVVRK